jgi:imidazoleglycerol phosphate dehydratase HisB
LGVQRNSDRPYCNLSPLSDATWRRKADGTSTAQACQSFAVSAGQTTYGWLFTRHHRLSSQTRLLAKAIGGATKAGDRASVKAA